MSKKLDLNKETLRSLTEEDLTGVSGGGGGITTGLMTQTPLCPSGATWFSGCGE